MSAVLAAAPRYARVSSRPDFVHVDVARDLNALMRVFALRALVYMGEQSCPFEEEFDGNDFAAATHLLAEVAGEPAGALRLRWFADFVKFERAAVKSDHRGKGVVAALIGEAFEMSRRRGYRRVIAYMQARLVPFWAPFGFRPRAGRDRFAFSDHEYVEGEAHLAPHPEALSVDSPPLVLMRPEGLWDRPGILDRSAARPPLNPRR